MDKARKQLIRDSLSPFNIDIDYAILEALNGAMRTYATQQVKAVLTECVSELGEGITMFSKERYRELLERTEKG